ncbi:MAG: type II secretion system protein M [Nitrospirota bacterium]
MNISGSNFKKMGLYLLIILSIARFAVVPAKMAVAKKTALVEDYLTTYASKSDLLQRYLAVDTKDDPEISNELAALVYPKGSNRTAIQTEIVNLLTKTAEANGLSVQNFQLIEGTEDTLLTEPSVLVRVAGQLRPIYGLFKAIQSAKPLLRIKSVEINVQDKGYIAKIVVTGYIRKI